MIHGACLVKPLNYQGAGASLFIDDNKIISTKKEEKIVCLINNIITLQYLEDWSRNNITLIKSEAELVNKIIDNQQYYLGKQFKNTIKEYKTDYGSIDIIMSDDDNFERPIIIEVKRNIINLPAVTQVLRYGQCFNNPKLYVAAPKINKSAAKYCDRSGVIYLHVDF